MGKEKQNPRNFLTRLFRLHYQTRFFYYTLHAKQESSREHSATMRISRKIELDYGHTLPNSFSFCNQLHGHRGVVVATVEGNVVRREGDGEEGMIMDFKFLKEIMVERIHDLLDHGFAVWKEDREDMEFIVKRNSRVLITDEPPTAECLAKWAYNQIREYLPEGVSLKEVRWYETPNNWADYDGTD